jgi:hypothetical protein
VKTFALLTLQTVNKQTLPKSADYRNEITREKMRLQITAVALDLDLPAALFEPATLTAEGKIPAREWLRALPYYPFSSVMRGGASRGNSTTCTLQ